jgi:uncharacterized protein (DUF305 family)
MLKSPRRSRPRLLAASLLCTVAVAGCGSGIPPAVTVTPVAAAAAAPPEGRLPAADAADARFMSGMIVHHAQAVLMSGWAHTHGASPAVAELCERINVSQRDEIAFMQRWLRERRLAVPDADTMAQRAMVGMDRPMSMGAMGHPMLMPGMLTGPELAQLDSARGPAFDRLFLTGMIRHHQGALTMVQDLMNTPGAAQDGLVFQFASDVNASQAVEIDRMRHMLAAELLGGRSQ